MSVYRMFLGPRALSPLESGDAGQAGTAGSSVRTFVCRRRYAAAHFRSRSRAARGGDRGQAGDLGRRIPSGPSCTCSFPRNAPSTGTSARTCRHRSDRNRERSEHGRGRVRRRARIDVLRRWKARAPHDVHRRSRSRVFSRARRCTTRCWEHGECRPRRSTACFAAYGGGRARRWTSFARRARHSRR